MSVLATDCPHCGILSLAFPAVSEYVGPKKRLVMLQCPRCEGGLIAEVVMNIVAVPTGWASGVGDFLEKVGNLHGRNLKIYPAARAIDVPQHLPESVTSLFRQAVMSKGSSSDGACMLFRRTLEVALKDLSPEVEARRLEKRIDALAARNLLTPSLQEWAHQIRIDGNEATHGEVLSSQEDAAQLEAFTRYVLIYLFTMPKQIELARGEAPPT